MAKRYTMEERIVLAGKIEELAAAGEYKKAAADRLNISVEFLNKLCKEFEIDYPVHRTNKEDREFIRIHFGRVPVGRIAEIIGFTPETVREWAEKFGLYEKERRETTGSIVFDNDFQAFAGVYADNTYGNYQQINKETIRLILKWRNAIEEIGSLVTYFDHFIEQTIALRFGEKHPVLIDYEIKRLSQWGVPLKALFQGIMKKEKNYEDVIL